MKNLGKVTDPKDITTKEYVDDLYQSLNETKLDESKMSEFTDTEIEEIWNTYMN